eukprot:scaffold890_cov103-Skeletonema_marinoi.AAC.1
MNSSDGAALSAPPKASALQPLVNRSRSQSGASKYSGGDTSNVVDDGDDDLEFTPFFSDDGKAPWEDGAAMAILPPFEDDGLGHDSNSMTPPPVQSANTTQSNSKGLALLSKLRQGRTAASSDEIDDNNLTASAEGKATDKTKKGSKKADKSEDDWFLTDKEITAKSQQEKLKSTLIDEGDNEHLVWMRQWVQSLPKVPPTNEFVTFHFNVDAIMKAMAV